MLALLWGNNGEKSHHISFYGCTFSTLVISEFWSVLDHLVITWSSEFRRIRLNFSKKRRAPVYPELERYEILSALKCVDEVFFEKSLELKEDYIKKTGAAVLVMGDDWQGKFDDFKTLCDVVYLPRTPAISTTEVMEKIRY